LGRYVLGLHLPEDGQKAVEIAYVTAMAALVGLAIYHCIRRQVFEENSLLPFQRIGQFDTRPRIILALGIERDSIRTSPHFFAVTPTLHVIVDPPNTAPNWMFEHPSNGFD
jgi:hypothetical protein